MMQKGVTITRASSYSRQNSAPFLNFRPSWLLCSYVITSTVGLLFPHVHVFSTEYFNRISTETHNFILFSFTDIFWLVSLYEQVTLYFIIHAADPPDTFPFPHEASLWKTIAAAKAWNLSADGSHLADNPTASSRILAPFLNRVPVRMVLKMEKTFLSEVP